MPRAQVAQPPKRGFVNLAGGFSPRRWELASCHCERNQQGFFPANQSLAMEIPCPQFGL